MTNPANSFGTAADLYDQARPGYPLDAVRWALAAVRAAAPTGAPTAPAGRLRVVDLGAGTGILSRVLLDAGHEVVPVEPDERMRGRLAAVTPQLAPRAGSAEATGLPDGFADAVLAAQAYHWFDKPRAHREMGRVVRPGGVFAPLWNLRDQREPWVVDLSEILDGVRRDATGSVPDDGWMDDADFGPDFGPVEREIFTHKVTHTLDTLLALVRSRSYYITAPPDRREWLERQVAGLVHDHPALAGAPEFDLPYQTVVYRAVRA